jgi:hypothetical protein
VFLGYHPGGSFGAGAIMSRRAAGKTVLFKGTADLGPKDGGVYDWIGRATEKEFVGFYTNAYYTGVFTLTRAK